MTPSAQTLKRMEPPRRDGPRGRVSTSSASFLLHCFLEGDLRYHRTGLIRDDEPPSVWCFASKHALAYLLSRAGHRLLVHLIKIWGLDTLGVDDGVMSTMLKNKRGTIEQRPTKSFSVSWVLGARRECSADHVN